ncbi:MAG TPA: hypothetical protein VD790_04445 [Thermoleophilaceae bacterium]|nr:hypothetical protein [Thermoleophilaceae bacterium]
MLPVFLMAVLVALSAAPVAAADSTETYTIPEGETASTSPDATPADPIQLSITTGARDGKFRVTTTDKPAKRIGKRDSSAGDDVIHAGPQFSITELCGNAKCWPSPYTVALVVDKSLIPEPGNRASWSRSYVEGKAGLAHMCRSHESGEGAGDCPGFNPRYSSGGRAANLIIETLPNGDVRLYEKSFRERPGEPNVIDFAHTAVDVSWGGTGDTSIGALLSGHGYFFPHCSLACRSTVTRSVSRSTANTFGLQRTRLSRGVWDEGPMKKSGPRPMPLGRTVKRKLADANRVTVIEKLVVKSAGKTYRMRDKVAFVRPPKPSPPPKDG